MGKRHTVNTGGGQGSTFIPSTGRIHKQGVPKEQMKKNAQAASYAASASRNVRGGLAGLTAETEHDPVAAALGVSPEQWYSMSKSEKAYQQKKVFEAAAQIKEDFGKVQPRLANTISQTFGAPAQVAFDPATLNVQENHNYGTSWDPATLETTTVGGTVTLGEGQNKVNLEVEYKQNIEYSLENGYEKDAGDEIRLFYNSETNGQATRTPIASPDDLRRALNN